MSKPNKKPAKKSVKFVKKEEYIRIRGARVNNLKSIDIDLPINKITCFAGPSGSGKTSLAFHTVYNESKRRFLNSFPNYLKFFSDRPAPVDVDEIFPVLPVFGLPQINPVVGTRAVVADTMRLSELFQNLYFNHARELCPEHRVAMKNLSLSEVLEKDLQQWNEEAKFSLAIARSDFLTYFSQSPFPSRSYLDSLRAFEEADPYWEVARFKKKSVSRVDKKVEEYLEKQIDIFLVDENQELVKIPVKNQKTCPVCHREGLYPRTPAKFTAYNALGACKRCNGFGSTLEYDEEKLVDPELAVDEGGIKLLEYKRFHQDYEDLFWELKAAGIPVNKPVKKLPKKFWNILYEGKGSFCGFKKLFKYLDSKRYKASVRIFIRGKQKEILCPVCKGARLSPEVEHFYLDQETSFFDLWAMSLGETKDYLGGFDQRSLGKDFKLASRPLK